MAKYTDDFKLEVINHYLNGYGYKQTAQTFGISHKQVEFWVKLYQTHGIDGISRRKSKAVYSAEFKHSVVLQILSGKSINALAIELNISNHGLLSQWLEAYNQYGIIGLKPKPKGRKPMTSSDKTTKSSKTKSPTNEHADLLRRIQYLEAENAYLKKLDALIRQKHKTSAPKKKS